MALAQRLDRQIGNGELRGYADIARLGHVTRARVTQIMSLLALAPDIQEALLYLPSTTKGRDQITERQVRPIMNTPAWRTQRRLFSKLMRVGVSR
ncbi:MAG: hypothetical protein L0Y42_10330 [Phycisphaerales bacterium]|nr:hypothetical protein [Phycisphaerales bacterium]